MKLTCSYDMLIRASAGFRELDEDASARVLAFTRSRQEPSGGFRGRGAGADLYFTVFGLGTLGAAGAVPAKEALASYLAGFRDGDRLDFVHRVCLVRCLAAARDLARLPAFLIAATARPGLLARLARLRGVTALGPSVAGAIVSGLEQYRTRDGGYEQDPAQTDCASAYACFLAWLAYQDAGCAMPDPDALFGCLGSLRRDDGSYANARSVDTGSTTATAAALVLLCEFGLPADPATIDCLLSRRDTMGGFRAGATTPVPDLLSTAAALYALSRAGVAGTENRDRDEAFVSSLWNEDGGFSGNALDAESDVEYTSYALLALGCLAT